ncbi:hypothetical protein BaRGS_00001087 [Batillaria attramentaria]|uniref:Uncharacterized protein n=1 Tax=Batillaria attramentaria TaxID=370345 RepID=A0ABD0M668_9CAEN
MNEPHEPFKKGPVTLIEAGGNNHVKDWVVVVCRAQVVGWGGGGGGGGLRCRLVVVVVGGGVIVGAGEDLRGSGRGRGEGGTGDAKGAAGPGRARSASVFVFGLLAVFPLPAQSNPTRAPLPQFTSAPVFVA